MTFGVGFAIEIAKKIILMTDAKIANISYNLKLKHMIIATSSPINLNNLQIGDKYLVPISYHRKQLLSF